MPPIERLLPHAGRMRLIDRLVAYDDERIVCESDSHGADDHPLAENGVLSIVCGLEYGAQAMAIHGALLAEAAPPASAVSRKVRHGYLVTAADLHWEVQRLDRCTGPLIIEAISEFRSGNQVAYRFELRADQRPVLTGRASVLLAG